VGDIVQGIDPQALFAQQDVTRVAPPGQDETIGMLDRIIQGFVDTARQFDTASRAVTPENLANVATMFGPVGDVRAGSEIPGLLEEGRPIMALINAVSMIPGVLGAGGDVARAAKGVKATPPLQQLIPEPSTAARLGQDPIAAQAQNQRLAERMGGPLTEQKAPLGIEAPPGSESVEANVRVLARRAGSAREPSQLFQGIEGLDKQGLAVFAKPISKDIRQIVSLTPNPKQPGGWKATIWEEVKGKGQTLLNTSDFSSRAEALEAVSGGHRFFEDFTEIPIGSAESMEEFFRGLL